MKETEQLDVLRPWESTWHSGSTKTKEEPNLNYQNYREEAGSTQLIVGKDGKIRDIDKETMTDKDQESSRKQMWMSEGEP